jgi:hypothetical protein
MPRRQRRSRSSLPLSDNSNDSSDGNSCFDKDDEPRGPRSDTGATDVDSDVEGGEKIDTTRIIQEGKDHPPEYYCNMEEDPESDDENKDYKEGSLSLIDGIEERFNR